MEDSFNKLKNEHKNSVDNLVKWIKDSKVIDDSKAAEDKVRQMFKDVKDVKDVEYVKFKDTLTKLAAEQKKSMEELTKVLSDEGPKLLNALQAGLSSAAAAGASAFKDAMKKK